MEELKRDPTQSDRRIAKKAKVSHHTVAKERAQQEDGGRIALRAHGTLTDAVRQSIRERKPAILAELAANDGATPAGEWYHVTRDGGTVEVAFCSPQSLAEARARYPGCAVEPIEPRPASVATPEQERELRALLAVVAADWPDRDEALAVALRDPADALTCFRYLAADKAPSRKYPEGLYTSAPLAERDPTDDRRTCADCANLSAIGRCRTPPFGTKRDCHPIPDALNRCERYAPKPGEPDQRPGAERWPSLVDDGKRRSEAAQHGY
ncbi:MAG: hypothetical protein IT518_25185 [Burkholderiales bacterium]|nr:hypothetical protein [Burkholderiales bacterium]